MYVYMYLCMYVCMPVWTVGKISDVSKRVLIYLCDNIKVNNHHGCAISYPFSASYEGEKHTD